MTQYLPYQLAKMLWSDYLKVEYYELSDLAKLEWDKQTASHRTPKYDTNGNRVGNHYKGEIGTDDEYIKNNARDDHYAVRTYVISGNGMGSNLVNNDLPNEAIFGHSNGYQKLPEGIALVGRIMQALGYTRGSNNLGPAYYSLNDPNNNPAKNMFADAVHFNPPKLAPELPKQFVSQIHIPDLKKSHPKMADYITNFMQNAADPFADLQDLLNKISSGDAVNQQEADLFLKAAAASIKERPWQLPIEQANAKNWKQEITNLNAVIEEHKSNPTEASQYALWTMFNGLRVNHEAFLTGNIYDTLAVHIIEGRKVIDPSGTELSLINTNTNNVEFGGLIQGAVAAQKRSFTFKAPLGCKDFTYKGQGPFVEYIERTLHKTEQGWQRINDAFLPNNAKQVFQSTMPDTRGKQSWSESIKEMLKEPKDFYEYCLKNRWHKSLERLITKGLV